MIYDVVACYDCVGCYCSEHLRRKSHALLGSPESQVTATCQCSAPFIIQQHRPTGVWFLPTEPARPSPAQFLLLSLCVWGQQTCAADPFLFNILLLSLALLSRAPLSICTGPGSEAALQEGRGERINMSTLSRLLNCSSVSQFSSTSPPLSAA